MELLLKQNTPVIPELTWRNAVGYVKQGIVNRLAKFAAYRAAMPTATTNLGSRFGMNPNSSLASIQRSSMMWTADDVAKNCSLAGAYYKIRTNYCDPLSYVPNTGDDVLNSELRDYLKQTWKTGGINCSFFEAFTRAANIEQPVRGDALLIYFRDESQLRVMEASADQIGKPYYYVQPARQNGVTYYAGIYASSKNGERLAFEVFERENEWYGERHLYPASDCLYFQDNIFRGWRGITTFANALQHMDKGEQLFQIGMDAAMRQSKDAFAVFNNSGAPDELTYEVVNPDGSVTVQQHTEGGPTIQYRYTGDSITPVPRDSPGEELIRGVEKSDERVALALGLTYAFMVSGEKVGGAPSRFDCARAGREIERIRERVLRPRLDQHAYICIMDAVDRGIFPPSPSIAKGDWHFSNLPSADAYKDSMEEIKSVRAGQDSDTRVCSRYGTTPEEIMRDKENETVLAYVALARAQKRVKESLAKEGLQLEDAPSIADIRQVSDNPQQSAQGEAIEKGIVAPNAAPNSRDTKMSAQLSEWDESKHPRNGAGEFSNSISGERVTKQEIDFRDKLSRAIELHPDLQKTRASLDFGNILSDYDVGVHVMRLRDALDKKGERIFNDADLHFAHQQLEQSDIAARASRKRESRNLGDKDLTAQLAAYMGDVSVADLPDDTREEIARILGTNGDTDKMTVCKYGMCADELLPKADPHNLESARRNIRNMPNYAAAQDVHDNGDKHILMMNGGIVDGHHHLAKAEKGKVTKSLHVLDLTPARVMAKLESFDSSKHPRGGKGTHEGGKFVKGSGTTGEGESSHESSIKPTKKRAWNGSQVQTKTQLSKLETGAIGEKVAIAYLKSKGFDDARTTNVNVNNFPVDLLQDHEAIEVKTGLVSNGDTAMHWRATIGQPGKEETAWLKSASKEEKKAWNERKSAEILKRKQQAIDEISKELGRKVKGKTLTMILNPDTKTADLYEFEGFHLRIAWKSDLAKTGFVGSFRYA